ncbi:hypothetical protein V7148_12715 [Gottfriedia acidiceleris]|nr:MULTISPECIES: hypothetical protein [unclassified Bacillus (in: firmicutes)]
MEFNSLINKETSMAFFSSLNIHSILSNKVIAKEQKDIQIY